METWSSNISSSMSAVRLSGAAIAKSLTWHLKKMFSVDDPQIQTWLVDCGDEAKVVEDCISVLSPEAGGFRMALHG